MWPNFANKPVNSLLRHKLIVNNGGAFAFQDLVLDTFVPMDAHAVQRIFIAALQESRVKGPENESYESASQLIVTTE